MKVAALLFAFLGIAYGYSGPQSGGRVLGGGIGSIQGGQGFDPRQGQLGLGSTIPAQASGSKEIHFSIAGVIRYEKFADLVNSSELRVIQYGPDIKFGESRIFDVIEGTANLDSGRTAFLTGGRLNIRLLNIADRQNVAERLALQESLKRAGITYNQLIQRTRGTSLETGIYDVITGQVTINGVARNVIAGVFVVVSAVDAANTAGSGFPGQAGSGLPGHAGSGFIPGQAGGQQPNVAPAITQTVTVTETAAHETTTVFEPVTLIKTQTQDVFVTITNPVYNSMAATFTNIVKQTVTIPEEQVIRSPVAGSVVVNTIPVPFQTTLIVSVRNTNMFVRTETDGVTNTHAHYVTNYSVRTATVNNPVTSTVVQTITQTQVSTVYSTSVVGSTVYATTTHTVNIGTGGATTQSGGYY